jgi:D-glycero-D-manno-heptose 1,7-bisphosphate phosphatase
VIEQANKIGLVTVIVSNQSGVGRGYYDWRAFERVMARIDLLLSADGASIDAIYACPFHADALPPYKIDDHPDRKPNPGMLTRAAHELDLDLAGSWIVGDSFIDVQAGVAAGCAGAVLLGDDQTDPRTDNAPHPADSATFKLIRRRTVEGVLEVLPILQPHAH